jgi:hypothetical protein
MDYKIFFRIEVIFFILLIILCIYLYWNYGSKVRKVKLFNDEYKDIFLNYVDAYGREDEFRSYFPKKKGLPKRGEWKNENRCRDIIQKIFQKEFKSVRPDFLKNPVTGKNLELDCYNEELKLAFEIDGVQHAKYTPYFHRGGVAQFEYDLKKDDFKTKKCKLEGVDLIRIPHFILPNNLEDYIRKEIDKIPRIKELVKG